MGRMKAGKNVQFRQALIRQAVAGVDTEDRYWMETLVARLTGEKGIQTIPAHVAALAAGWEEAEIEIARIVRRSNTPDEDPYKRLAIDGLSKAAPEFGRRVAKGEIDTDEIFLRVVLAHLFRRDPASAFQMYTIDGAVRALARGMQTTVQSFVSSCLGHYEDDEVPKDMWGYVVVLHDMVGRSGYLIPRGTDLMKEKLARTRKELEVIIGEVDDITFANHATAAYVESYVRNKKFGSFAKAMAPVLDLIGHRCIVAYSRPGGQGFHTVIRVIPTDDPYEARKIVGGMVEVALHDQFREISEMVRQAQDRDDLHNY